MCILISIILKNKLIAINSIFGKITKIIFVLFVFLISSSVLRWINGSFA